MDTSRRRLVLIWLATTGAVAIAVLVAYRVLIRVPELAGRTDPETLLEDPQALFEDPGLIGSAVEIRVTRAIASCMEARGFDYRGPASVDGLDETLDPATHGYGIATGPSGGGVTLGDGGAERFERDAYEQALYGTSLDGGGSSGGCAAVGARELQDAMATIDALPYSIRQLEADALAHPSMVAGLEAWSACMTGAGYPADTPADLIADLVARLSRATPEEARALAEEERRIATADFACRDQHLARAVEDVAEELAPAFVEANREQLESLMPPEPTPYEGVTVPTDLGTGDVQVTVLWTDPVDIDLHVTGPDGITIDYNNRTPSNSPGRLDRDANAGCSGIVADPVENVFWAEGAAPRGTYSVRVNLFRDCGQTGPFTYTLIVRVGGRVVIQDQRTTEGGDLFTEFTY